MSDFLHETDMAPNGKHDDQIDPMLDAISDMLVTNSGFVFAC
jgi:hypothetical protein